MGEHDAVGPEVRGTWRAVRAPARPRTLRGALHEELRLRHYSERTLKAYDQWVRRYLRFHRPRHPRELGSPGVRAFLVHLTEARQVSAATLNQAHAALRFLYRDVLGRPEGWLDDLPSAKASVKLPSVLSRAEVQTVVEQLDERTRLVVLLLYGSGLRLQEALSLRVKDLSVERHEVVVRDGKGGKDRITMLAEAAVPLLRTWLEARQADHQSERRRGEGAVLLPEANARKSPEWMTAWAWQYLFPASQLIECPATHRWVVPPLHPSAIQRLVASAGRAAALPHRVTCHIFRHSFATHLLEDGYDIRTVQELLGHRDVRTTMIYTHVLQRGGRGVKSPMDRWSG